MFTPCTHNKAKNYCLRRHLSLVLSSAQALDVPEQRDGGRALAAHVQVLCARVRQQGDGDLHPSARAAQARREEVDQATAH